jgi:hypothetical protein
MPEAEAASHSGTEDDDMVEDSPLTTEEMEAAAEALANGTHSQRIVTLHTKVLQACPESVLPRPAGMGDTAEIPGGAEGSSFMSLDEMQAQAEALANGLSQVGRMSMLIR